MEDVKRIVGLLKKNIFTVIILLCAVIITVNGVIKLSEINRSYSDIKLSETITARLYNDGQLRLMGEGDTPDYSLSSLPAIYEQRDYITGLVIDEGITSIGDYMFYGCKNLTGELVLPQSLTYIGDYAFSGSSYSNSPKFTAVINNFNGYTVYEFDQDVDIVGITGNDNVSAYDMDDSEEPVRSDYTLQRVDFVRKNIIRVLDSASIEDEVLTDYIIEKREIESEEREETEPQQSAEPEEPKETEPQQPEEIEEPKETEPQQPAEPEEPKKTEPQQPAETEEPKESEPQQPTETEKPKESEPQQPTETEEPKESESQQPTEPEEPKESGPQQPTEPEKTKETATEQSTEMEIPRETKPQQSAETEIPGETKPGLSVEQTMENTEDNEHEPESVLDNKGNYTATVIYEQEIGRNVFFEGQTGIYKCTSANRTFLNAVQSAGYIPYDKFTIVSDLSDIIYAGDQNACLSVWATAENSQDISYRWEINTTGEWQIMYTQLESTINIDAVEAIIKNASYRCRIEYKGEVLYSDAAAVILELPVPEFRLSANSAVFETGLPGFPGYVFTIRWQYSNDMVNWFDAEETGETTYIRQLQDGDNGRYFRYAPVLRSEGSAGDVVLVQLQTSEPVMLSYSLTETGDKWSGEYDTTWYNTDEDVFNISTAEQLAGLARIVCGMAPDIEKDDFRGKTIRLKKNIILNDFVHDYTENWNLWIPIGLNQSSPFAGTFNGNGYKISGVYINTDDCSYNAGLFGYAAECIIRNLNVSDVYVVKPSTYGTDVSKGAGGIAAYAADSEITGCSVNGIMLNGSVNNVGGVVGEISQGTVVSYCRNDGQIVCYGDDIGGIVGRISEDSMIKSCTNYGSITGNQNAGGIAGHCLFSTVIRDCINFGDTEAIDGSSGGIAAYAQNNCLVDNCINEGRVSASEYAGGICGYSNYIITNSSNDGAVSTLSECAGGIMGSGKAYIYNCRNIGDISGSSEVGGICGVIDENQVINCCSSGKVSGNSFAASIAGKTENGACIKYCYSDGDICASGGSTVLCGIILEDGYSISGLGSSELLGQDLTGALNEYISSVYGGGLEVQLYEWADRNGDGMPVLLPDNAYAVLGETHGICLIKQNEVMLTKESSFTAIFENRYDIQNIDRIVFTSKIPEKTRMVLSVSDGETRGYYYYNVGRGGIEGNTGLMLDVFCEMGSRKQYAPPEITAGSAVMINVSLDFSACTEEPTDGGMYLEGTHIKSAGVRYSFTENRQFKIMTMKISEWKLSGTYSTGTEKYDTRYRNKNAVLALCADKDGESVDIAAEYKGIVYKPVGGCVNIPVDKEANGQFDNIRIFLTSGKPISDEGYYRITAKLCMSESLYSTKNNVVFEKSIGVIKEKDEKLTFSVSRLSNVVNMPVSGEAGKAVFQLSASIAGGTYKVKAVKWNADLGEFEGEELWDFSNEILTIPAGSKGTYKLIFTYTAAEKSAEYPYMIIVY